MKLAVALSLLSFFPLLGQSAEVVHQREELLLAIPDQGSVRYVINDLSPLVADRVQLELVINHPRPSDLMVMLLSPLGKYALLPITPSIVDDSWVVDVSSDGLLDEFIGENSFGSWEVHLYDQVQGNSGTVQSIKFEIIGNRPLLSDPTGSTVVVGNSCSEKWSNLLDQKEYKAEYQQVISQCDIQLRQSLFGLVDGHRSLSYDRVRQLMFTSLDNQAGEVCSIYSERCIKTYDIPSNSVMNCEHTWPQSLGATGDAKTDLHHLFPAISKENSDRNSFPFCEVIESRESVTGKLGTSTSGFQCYEPPDRHKGNTARAMFYFALRYQKKIDPLQEATLRKWNRQDPVSSSELMRNSTISSIQGKSNPFIDHPEFVDLILDF